MKRFFLGILCGWIFLVAVGIAVTSLGIIPTRADVPPPHWEKRIAGFALDASIMRHAPKTQNPLPANEENLMKGMLLYQKNCESCHGNVLEKSKRGASFYPPVPQFGKRALRGPDSQIHWIVRNGIRYTGMLSFNSQLTDNEIWQVALFLKHLDSLSPQVNKLWLTPKNNKTTPSY